jgi:hypothetical protein
MVLHCCERIRYNPMTETPKYTCRRETSLTLVINAGDGEMCEATIREWKGGGSIQVQSGWGNYAYSWSAIGSRTFTNFLSGLTYDYAMGKFMGTKDYVDDRVKFMRQQRDEIIEARRDRRIEKDTARDLWMACEHFEGHDSTINLFTDMSAPDDFGGVERSFVEALYGPAVSPYELTMPVKRDPHCAGFWDKHWPCIIAELQKIEAEKLAERLEVAS